ncbi:hypothetical protein POM88_026737 [Heracleum sosnowskyi]|uniref:Bifunctional inhibitor/plant lipid transfer protein/seed storage helical domain-containing protein n=1 Tax=Heracleum sosnowskyi TaxID=360622 RepID=A0AAD8I8U3_9APIA|nr:hypothetical protein POM88_026737 [Heracleum sosnowskyi]
MAAELISRSRSLPALTIAMIVLILPVHGQISTACSPSALTNFTPCINFITNSTANGTSPTTDCCNSLKSIASSSTDCLCLIVTASVPFQIPINRTLAIALPRACNMPGVPLQCKASASPLPAPGPAALAPTLSPGFSPSASPKASGIPEAQSPAMTPKPNATPALTPPSDSTGAPTTNSGIRPVLTPSAASPLFSVSPAFLLAVLGATFLKLDCFLMFLLCVTIPSKVKAQGGCFLQGINLEACGDQNLYTISESCCRSLNQALEIGFHCLCSLLPIYSTIPLLNFPSDLPLPNCYISVPSLAQCQGPISGVFSPATPVSLPLSPVVPEEKRQATLRSNCTSDRSAAITGRQYPSSNVDAQSVRLSSIGNATSHCDNKVKKQLHQNVGLLVITLIASLYLEQIV